MKKYKTEFGRIELVDAERESVNSVWINGRRHPRHSGWMSFYEAFEDAKHNLLVDAHLAVKRAKQDLDDAETALAVLQGLRECDVDGVVIEKGVK